MPDLIRREDALDTLDRTCDLVCRYSKPQRSAMCGACELGSAFDAIDAIPAVDAVEVVRCRECKHSRLAGDNLFCNIHRSIFDQERGRLVLDGSYCSWGKRREDGDA